MSCYKCNGAAAVIARQKKNNYIYVFRCHMCERTLWKSHADLKSIPLWGPAFYREYELESEMTQMKPQEPAQKAENPPERHLEPEPGPKTFELDIEL